jgi:hypothetical protein
VDLGSHITLHRRHNLLLLHTRLHLLCTLPTDIRARSQELMEPLDRMRSSRCIRRRRFMRLFECSLFQYDMGFSPDTLGSGYGFFLLSFMHLPHAHLPSLSTLFTAQPIEITIPWLVTSIPHQLCHVTIMCTTILYMYRYSPMPRLVCFCDMIAGMELPK